MAVVAAGRRFRFLLGRWPSGPRAICLASGSYVPPAAEARLRELQAQMQRLHAAGSYEAARGLAEECRSLALGEFGPEHPVSASAVNNLALMHKSLGQTERATVLYREALELYGRSVGEAHRSTATVACNLALLLRDTAMRDTPENGPDDAGDGTGEGITGQASTLLDEAQTLLEGAVATRSQVLGERHPEASLARSQLASVLRAKGRLDHASELLERAVEDLDSAHFTAEATHGPEGKVTSRIASLLASALNSLALLRKQQERLADAEPLYHRASALYDRSSGPSSPDAIVCRYNLAELALVRGDDGSARQIQQDILQRVNGAGEPNEDRSV